MELTRGPPVDRDLARIVAARGMIISYATQAGQTAADGQGRNSPYTMAFLKNIETTDEISTIFRHITADVDTATRSKQLPELSLSVVGDFCLNRRTESQISQPTPGSSDAERAWTVTQNTTSQAILEDFVRAVRQHALWKHRTCAAGGVEEATCRRTCPSAGFAKPEPLEFARHDQYGSQLVFRFPVSSQQPCR